MRGPSKRRVSWKIVLLVTALCVVPSQGEQRVDQLIAYILDALESPQIACDEPVLAEYPGKRVVCASYGGAFSGLKSDWEILMRHTHLPIAIRTDDPWTFKNGAYRIAYTHDETRKLLVAFESETRNLRFAYTEADVDPYAARSTAAKAGPLDLGEPGTSPRMAGFGGVSMPELIEETRVEPLRSFRAQAERVVGTATLEIVVQKDGTVRDAFALSAEPKGYDFGVSAVEAVRQWKFKPAIFKGQPIDAAMNLKVEIKHDPAPPGDAENDAGKG